MIKQRWEVNLAEKPHTLEVEGGDWAVRGSLKVDGNTEKAWYQWFTLPKEVDFEVGGEKASLKRKSTFASEFDLYIGEKKY